MSATGLLSLDSNRTPWELALSTFSVIQSRVFSQLEPFKKQKMPTAYADSLKACREAHRGRYMTYLKACGYCFGQDEECVVCAIVVYHCNMASNFYIQSDKMRLEVMEAIAQRVYEDYRQSDNAKQKRQEITDASRVIRQARQEQRREQLEEKERKETYERAAPLLISQLYEDDDADREGKRVDETKINEEKQRRERDYKEIVDQAERSGHLTTEMATWARSVDTEDVRDTISLCIRANDYEELLDFHKRMTAPMYDDEANLDPDAMADEAVIREALGEMDTAVAKKKKSSANSFLVPEVGGRGQVAVFEPTHIPVLRQPEEKKAQKKASQAQRFIQSCSADAALEQQLDENAEFASKMRTLASSQKKDVARREKLLPTGTRKRKAVHLQDNHEFVLSVDETLTPKERREREQQTGADKVSGEMEDATAAAAAGGEEDEEEAEDPTFVPEDDRPSKKQRLQQQQQQQLQPREIIKPPATVLVSLGEASDKLYRETTYKRGAVRLGLPTAPNATSSDISILPVTDVFGVMRSSRASASDTSVQISTTKDPKIPKSLSSPLDVFVSSLSSCASFLQFCFFAGAACLQQLDVVDMWIISKTGGVLVEVFRPDISKVLAKEIESDSNRDFILGQTCTGGTDVVDFAKAVERIRSKVSWAITCSPWIDMNAYETRTRAFVPDLQSELVKLKARAGRQDASTRITEASTNLYQGQVQQGYCARVIYAQVLQLWRKGFHGKMSDFWSAAETSTGLKRRELEQNIMLAEVAEIGPNFKYIDQTIYPWKYLKHALPSLRSDLSTLASKDPSRFRSLWIDTYKIV